MARNASSDPNQTLAPHCPGEIQTPLGRREQRDDGEAGRIAGVLAVDAEQKLGSDRHDAGNRRQPRRVSSQQQAQRQAGDQRRAQIDPRQSKQARTDHLGRECARNRERAIKRLGAEIDPDKIDGKQGRQRHDLEVAGIEPPGAHGRLPLVGAPMPANRDARVTDRWPDSGGDGFNVVVMFDWSARRCRDVRRGRFRPVGNLRASDRSRVRPRRDRSHRNGRPAADPEILW